MVRGSLLVIFLWMFSLRAIGFEFQDVTVQSGLQPSLAGMMGHAAAWGDFDNDGRPDLFIAGFCDRPSEEYKPAKGPVPSRLFKNVGNGKFSEVRGSATEFCGRTSGALFVDLNRDNLPELYVSNNAKSSSKRSTEPQKSAQIMRSRMYLNDKTKFVDKTSQSGAVPPDLQTARSVAAFDYNLDGLLDLFVVEDKFKKGKSSRSVLLKNKGNLTFQVANDEAGIPNDVYGLGVAIADLNDDRIPDIFVAHSNRLFLSKSGSKYGEPDEISRIFQWNPSDGEDWPCGAAFGDLNLDGNMDLVLTIHHQPARNKIFLNKGLKNGIPQFEDVSNAAGWNNPVPVKTPHVEIQDFDNDGLPDIYTTSAGTEGGNVFPLIYRNEGISSNGIPRFTSNQKSQKSMVYFPTGPTVDYDQDGRLDVLLVNWFPEMSSHLLKNQSKSGNWLRVKGPIGARIKVFSQSKMIGHQQIFIGTGYACGGLPVAHFGLANLKAVDLKAWLPDGAIKDLKNISANQTIDLSTAK